MHYAAHDSFPRKHPVYAVVSLFCVFRRFDIHTVIDISDGYLNSVIVLLL